MTESVPKPVHWLKAADDDLAEIIDRISKDDPIAASNFLDRIFSLTELLERSPLLGAVCPYSRKVRQLIHGKYVIYYSVGRSEILIRAIVHGARLFRRNWLIRDEKL